MVEMKILVLPIVQKSAIKKHAQLPKKTSSTLTSSQNLSSPILTISDPKSLDPPPWWASKWTAPYRKLIVHVQQSFSIFSEKMNFPFFSLEMSVTNPPVRFVPAFCIPIRSCSCVVIIITDVKFWINFSVIGDVKIMNFAISKICFKTNTSHAQ